MDRVSHIEIHEPDSSASSNGSSIRVATRKERLDGATVENFPQLSLDERKAQLTNLARNVLSIKAYDIPTYDRESLISAVSKLKENLENTLDPEKSDIDTSKLINRLEEKISELNTFSYSPKELASVIDLYIMGLKEAGLEEGKDGAIKELENLKQKYTDPSYKNFVNFFNDAKSLYREVLSRRLNFSQDEIDRHTVQMLNKNPDAWNTIRHTFAYIDLMGKSHDLESVTIPLRESGIMVYIEGSEIRGISSFDRDSPDLQNAQTSILKHNGKIIFKGMRHGCINDKESRAQEMLQMAIFEKLDKKGFDNIKDGETIDLKLCSTQLLTHTNIAGDGKIGLNQIHLLQQYSIDENPDGIEFELNLPNDEKKKITLKLHLLTFNFGVNMQTRWHLGRSAEEDSINLENIKNMLGEDFLSLKKKIVQEDLDLTLKDIDRCIEEKRNEIGYNYVEVEGRRVPLNVNVESLKNFLKIERGYDERKDALLNRDKIGGAFGERLKEIESQTKVLDSRVLRPPNDPLTIKRWKNNRQKLKDEKYVLLKLANQIEELWTSGKYRAAKDNPYAMPARTAYSAYKLGYVSAYNCKSGKDRTGVLDAEVKNLAAYIEVNNQVPPLDEELTQTDVINLTMLHIFCGSPEVLKDNTGVMGSKIPNMPGVDKRFGDGNYSKKGEGDFRGVTGDVCILGP